MFSSIILANFFAFCINNLIGCWNIVENALYQTDNQGKVHLISRQVDNVQPKIVFLYNGRGYIEYCNDKTIPFDWQTFSDTLICKTVYEENLEDHVFTVNELNGNIVLSEKKKDSTMATYLLMTEKYVIEKIEYKMGVVIKNKDYIFFKKSNPYPYLRSIIAVGREKDNHTLEIEDSQEYLELQNCLPNSQSVLFLKSKTGQQIIPCFLLTHDKEGRVIFANFLKYVNQGNQRFR